MKRYHKLIKKSFDKFRPNLSGRLVLTEAATGNYVCTPILAAMAGADVYALAKNSKYGSIQEIISQIDDVAGVFGLRERIHIIIDREEAPLNKIDVVTNTGFVRPIDRALINKLKPECVIPLMWEPWEYRESDLDLEACREKGIKVYGTNENDSRLQTFKYLGFIALHYLLEEKRTPMSSKVLVIGGKKFNQAVTDILKENGYEVTQILSSSVRLDDITEYDVFVLVDHEWGNVLIGDDQEALIKINQLKEDDLIIHICGRVCCKSLNGTKMFRIIPENPAPFGYMSFTTDFIDPVAVFDLHAAGLKVAEGMLEAHKIGITGFNYKTFIESNYPGLSFENEKYW